MKANFHLKPASLLARPQRPKRKCLAPARYKFAYTYVCSPCKKKKKMLKRKHSQFIRYENRVSFHRDISKRGPWPLRETDDFGLGFVASGSWDLDLILSLWKTFFIYKMEHVPLTASGLRVLIIPMSGG